MHIDEFDYELPPSAIAQHPRKERGSSRLLVLDRARGTWVHSEFRRLPEWLEPGDLVVRNDTRVMHARLRGERASGGAVEILLLRREAAEEAGEVWTCLTRPGRRLHEGAAAAFPGGIVATWLDNGDDEGVRRVRLRAPRAVVEMLEEVGEVPLPPYIERAASVEDAAAYQTVYAGAPGAVAAPTAGLHFTEGMFRELESRGIRTATLTLHVGPGTFLPVRTERIEEHRMASEAVEIPAETASAVADAKRDGRRVVAIGTTTVRALEGLLAELEPRAQAADVSLFIRPGFRFRVVDVVLTNFHLPRSTLLMLVAALAGRALVLAAYRDAVAAGYRFYSYGDAMLVR